MKTYEKFKRVALFVVAKRRLSLGIATMLLAVMCFHISENAKASSDLVSQMGVDLMPDDCNNPYPDVGGFLAFYDNTISMMVAKRGPTAKGVTDLFAVSELRTSLEARIPNPSSESALDRLIISQLCQFREAYINQNPSLAPQGAGKRVLIESSNEALYDHLAKIAPKLYKESREYASQVVAELAREERKNVLLVKKRDEIRRARAMGHAKVEDLFN